MPAIIPNTSITELISREPVRIRTNTSLIDVVMAMKEVRRGAAIVEDSDGKIIGIITERHLMTKIDHSSFDWHTKSVNEVMYDKPKTIKTTQFVNDALAIMITCKFRHVPVIDEDNHVVVLVSIRDIIMYVAKLYPQEFLNLPPQPASEAAGRYGG
jgi:signal-transduction protein with cAMP-binding, CBS, and nucleotidyltransferase domain